MHSSAAVAPGLANSHAPHPPVGQPVLISGPTSPQSSLLATGQSYLLFPSFTLESGITLTNVPIAFKTWGQLDPVNKDNVLVVAHALTGSADVEDWWGPLLGPGKLFDPTRYFIFCANVLGSPYGSAGPCTRKGGEEYDWQTGEYKAREGWKGDGWWGPEFPATTVRDDVR
jgi:homoserine O-acetyltransferase/O-succinyltransferase